MKTQTIPQYSSPRPASSFAAPGAAVSITVSIVENDLDLCESLQAVLNSEPGFQCVSVHHSAEDALARLPRQKPDVVLLDLYLPGLSGSDCVRTLRACLRKSKILVLTIEDQTEAIFKTLKAGADGYLEKPVPLAGVMEAIRRIHAGDAPMSPQIARLVLKSFHKRGQASVELATLTAREEQVLASLAEGRTYKEMAGQLGIGTQTVNDHVKNIYTKLHVRSRTEAVAKFLRR